MYSLDGFQFLSRNCLNWNENYLTINWRTEMFKTGRIYTRLRMVVAIYVSEFHSEKIVNVGNFWSVRCENWVKFMETNISVSVWFAPISSCASLLRFARPKSMNRVKINLSVNALVLLYRRFSLFLCTFHIRLCVFFAALELCETLNWFVFDKVDLPTYFRTELSPKWNSPIEMCECVRECRMLKTRKCFKLRYL